MIKIIPFWIEIVFLATFLVTISFFYFSNNKPKTVTLLIVLWSIIHSILAYNGFYQITNSDPPRFGLVLIPLIFVLIFGFSNKNRNWVIQNRNFRVSTFLHTIRIPIEIVLFYLFFYQMIPELMTFEGRNFDIFAGISAPIIGVLYLKGEISKQILLAWNIISLFLVSFIFINGILSAELPFQQFAFEQPNKAINFFPFILLPATIVPIVIYTHITDILILTKEIKKDISN